MNTNQIDRAVWAGIVGGPSCVTFDALKIGDLFRFPKGTTVYRKLSKSASYTFADPAMGTRRMMTGRAASVVPIRDDAKPAD